MGNSLRRRSGKLQVTKLSRVVEDDAPAGPQGGDLVEHQAQTDQEPCQLQEEQMSAGAQGGDLVGHPVRLELQQLQKEQMSDDHKQKLRKNRVVIVQTLKNLPGIVDHLLQNQSINSEEAQTILCKETDQEKVRELLAILQIRSEAAFYYFIQALLETQETTQLYQLLKDRSMPERLERSSGPPTHGPAGHFHQRLKDFHKTKLESHDLGTHIQMTLYDKQSSSVENRHGFRELSMVRSRRTPIQQDDLFAKLQDDSDPRTVLMIGAPGVGKTATCLYFLQQFLNLKLWSSTFHFVFFIILRELGRFKTNISLQDLVFNCFGPSFDNRNDQEHVWRYLESHQDDILFILDGLDEIYGNDTNEDFEIPIHSSLYQTFPKTLLYKLIQGNFLRRSKILISSRPHMAGLLKDKVHRTVELLGLTFDDFRNLTKRVFQNRPKLALDICKHIENRPEIMNLCTSPINSKGLLNHIKESHSEDDQELLQDCLPASIAALLYFLIMNLLRNHNQVLMKKSRLTHRSIVQQCKTLIQKLAHMAYDGLFRQQTNQQQIFDEADLCEHSLDIQEVVTSGLMSGHLTWIRDTYWDVEKAFFEFPHLTFQEYLAALKLAQV